MSAPTPDTPDTPDAPDAPGAADGQRPEFGPGGYLPGRAARRARKIVLRAPLGVQWIVASLVAGLVVVVAGVTFLLRAGGPPDAPFEAVAALAAVGDQLHVGDVLVVGAGGRVRAFAAPADVAYCPASNRLEGPVRVWSLTGRALDGGASLDEHPVVVVDGTVYLDRTRTIPGPPGTDEGATPACAG